MTEPLAPLPAIGLLLGLGAALQWCAFRLRTPAILLLLLAGFALGPGLSLLDPDATFGVAFRPLVSLAVAFILFEGGLSLQFDELRGSGRVVRNLVSFGALVSWAATAIAAVVIADLEVDTALLVGAILVLTGPTVVIPIVRHVRPRPPLGAILRWEGILIDPIGALLALLVLEAIVVPGGATPWGVASSMARTLGIGGLLGWLAGSGLARALQRYLVPDMLHVPVTLGCVAATFALANSLQSEAGLVAVTVMGIVLANRRGLDIVHIAEWKEHLATVLLSALFLSIAARLPMARLTEFGWAAVVFAAVLVVVVRPLAVWCSTLGSPLSWRERGFLMAMAPRGIVVAAVASEFSLHLEHAGRDDGAAVVGLVFPVIVITVAFYGAVAAPLARWLGVAQADPQGLLVVGADVFGREFAQALREVGIDVLLVDTNAANAAASRMQGLRTWHGSVLSARFLEEAELGGLGNVLALTPSEEVNRLALQLLRSTFGSAGLFRLASSRGAAAVSSTGRVPFALHATNEWLRGQLAAGARIRSTRLTDVFGAEQYRERLEPGATLLAAVDGGRLTIATAEQPLPLRVGTTVLALVPAAARQMTS